MKSFILVSVLLVLFLGVELVVWDQRRSKNVTQKDCRCSILPTGSYPIPGLVALPEKDCWRQVQLEDRAKKNTAKWHKFSGPLFLTKKTAPGVISKVMSEPVVKRFNTCAVVASGGIMLTQEFGREIDKHDTVIRMNNAPTIGYERFVGSKSSVRISFPPYCGSFIGASSEEADILCVRAVEPHLQNMWATAIPFVKMVDTGHDGVIEVLKHHNLRKEAWKPKQLLAFSVPFNSYLQKWTKSPSTGFAAVVYALHVCNETTLYGFSNGLDLGEDVSQIPYHYFSDIGGAWLKKHTHHAHHMDREMEFILSWHSKGMLKLRHVC